MKQVFIIRWSAPVLFPSGVKSCIATKSGTWQEVEEYAQKIAKEHGVNVECIV